MRRSGTTWIGKLFDSHPDTVYRHEPDSIFAMDGVPYYPDLEKDRLDADSLSTFFDAVDSASRPHIVAKLPLFPKNFLGAVSFATLRASASMSKVVKRLAGVELPVLNVLKSLPDYRGTLVWKSVEAPCRVGLFATSLPKSRSVFVMRHPCGYLNSYVRGQDSGNMPATTDDDFDVGIWERRLTSAPARARGIDIDAVRRWSRKERMVWEWVIDNEKALADIDGLDNVLLVNYDALCEDPVAGTRAMIEFAGLEWDEQTEAFIGAGAARDDARYFSVMKDPRIAANAWKEQLAAEDRQLVIDIVAGSPLAEHFNDMAPSAAGNAGQVAG